MECEFESDSSPQTRLASFQSMAQAGRQEGGRKEGRRGTEAGAGGRLDIAQRGLSLITSSASCLLERRARMINGSSDTEDYSDRRTAAVAGAGKRYLNQNHGEEKDSSERPES